MLVKVSEYTICFSHLVVDFRLCWILSQLTSLVKYEIWWITLYTQLAPRSNLLINPISQPLNSFPPLARVQHLAFDKSFWISGDIWWFKAELWNWMENVCQTFIVATAMPFQKWKACNSWQLRQHIINALGTLKCKISENVTHIVTTLAWEAKILDEVC